MYCSSIANLQFPNLGLSFIDHDPSIGNDIISHPMNLHAFEDIEIDGMMMRLGRNSPFLVRIPDDDVSIGSRLNDPLTRVEVEYLGRSGAGDLDESLLGHDALGHSALPNDRHAVFQAVDTVGDLGEIVQAKSLLLTGKVEKMLANGIIY